MAAPQNNDDAPDYLARFLLQLALGCGCLLFAMGAALGVICAWCLL